jgi:hypothetical protein
VEALGRVVAAQGHLERAARLYGAVTALRETLHTPLRPIWRAEMDRAVTAARAALGEEAFAAAWAQGRAMTLEEAVREARRDA